MTEYQPDVSQVKANPTNQVAASFKVAPPTERIEQFEGLSGCKLEVLCGEKGADALTPDGLVETAQRLMSVEGEAVERLIDVLNLGGTVVVATEVHDPSTVDQLSQAMVESGAGWVFHFDELSWTALYSPHAPDEN